MPEIKIPFPELHKKVEAVSKSLYESGHFTDALRKASIKLEEECKSILKDATWEELTGVVLMQKLFWYKSKDKQRKSEDIDDEIADVDGCLFPFVNLSLKDSPAKQQSYCNLFSGFAGSIRNTLAHSSDDLEDIEALYGLNIVSYLFYKLDRAKELNEIILIPEIPPPAINLQEMFQEFLDKTFFESIIEKILSDPRIQEIPNQTQDLSNAKLSIEKITEDILVGSIDEIWDYRFNQLMEEPLKQEMINTLITKLYDPSN